MRWSGPWTIVGRTLGANRLLACSACGRRQRGRPLNSVVSHHLKSGASEFHFLQLERSGKYRGNRQGSFPALNRSSFSVRAASSFTESPPRSFALLGLRGFVGHRVAVSANRREALFSGPVHTPGRSCQTFGIGLRKANDG